MIFDERLITNNPQLAAAMAEALPIIDDALAAAGIPLSSRADLAAFEFCKDFASFTPETEPDSYITKKWFRIPSAIARQWYNKRYGEEALRPRHIELSAAVMIFGMPFLMEVPPLITTHEVQSRKTTLTFTARILDDENPLAWIRLAPPMQNMDGEISARLLLDARRAASLTRAYAHRLHFATYGNQELSLQAESARGHLDSAVSQLCSREPHLHSHAVWELQMTIEQTLKLFIRRSGQDAGGHTLDALLTKAFAAGLATGAELQLSGLPDVKLAGQFRYGEVQAPSQKVLFGYYDVVLAAVEFISRQMPQAHQDPMTITIGDAPWLREDAG